MNGSIIVKFVKGQERTLKVILTDLIPKVPTNLKLNLVDGSLLHQRSSFVCALMSGCLVISGEFPLLQKAVLSLPYFKEVSPK